jgi:hypothetical protein
MAPIDAASLRAQAKRAYEVGRLREAAAFAVFVVPMVVLSLLVCQQPGLSGLGGSVLLSLAVGFRWRGGALGRAVLPGLLAGSVPLVLPVLMRSSGHCCIGGACWSICMLGCVAGGVLAGVAVGVASRAEQEGRWAFLSAATLIAGLSGLLGCAVVGTAGIVGMVISCVVSSLQVAVVARLRSAA